jgi:hypothetical protein
VAAEDLFALEIAQQVERVIALLLTWQTDVALVEVRLKQVLVEATTQVEHTAELLTVLAQVLNKIILALLVFAGTIAILLKYLLVTIASQTSALHHREAVVVKLLQVVLVIVLVAIFQILVVLVQAHLNLAHVVITTQEQLFLQMHTPITAQPLFKAPE